VITEEDNVSENEEVFSSGPLSTNTIVEEMQSLVVLIESNFNQVHKIPFGKMYPSRIWTSNVLFSLLFYLQEPVDPKSLENLNDILPIKRIDFDHGEVHNLPFAENCVLFHTMLALNAND